MACIPRTPHARRSCNTPHGRKGRRRTPCALLAAGMTAVLVVSAAPVRAIDANEMFDDPAREARARDIGRELRCLVCQNQSIFDSNAGLARDLRIVVRERMDAGDSDAEVLAFVRERFGDYVLLNPPVTPQTYALWLAPVALLLLGAGLFGSYLRGRSPETRDTVQMSDADLAEARRILGEEKP